MIKAFYRSKKWAPWAYGGGAALIASLWIQVQITVAINTWYGGFYNLLQKPKNISDSELLHLMIFATHFRTLQQKT